jgi:hypothetical protein
MGVVPNQATDSVTFPGLQSRLMNERPSAGETPFEMIHNLQSYVI